MTEPLEIVVERRNPNTTAESLRKSLRRLVAATLVLYLVMGAVALKIYIDGRATHDSLCTFRADLANRALASTDFLRDHPNGVAGIPPKIILEGIYNQQRTIVALKDLDCEQPPESELEAIPTPPTP